MEEKLRIIIDINKHDNNKCCDLPTIMKQLKSVVDEGFISENNHGRHFCCVTKFSDETVVYCDLLKSGTHKMIVETR